MHNENFPFPKPKPGLAIRSKLRRVSSSRVIVSSMCGESSSKEAYDRFAPIYDEFNVSNNYELWVGGLLLAELEEHGLRRETGRVLDVGCGTGRAFEPLLKRGWQITGCDASPAMLARARDNMICSAVALCDCDARDLPRFSAGPFDLILFLNDVVNYLTGHGDLARAFSGAKCNLAPHGLVCFDTNTLGLYQESYASGRSAWMSAAGHTWRGLSDKAVAGAIHEAEVVGPEVERHIHRQRHWPEQQVAEALNSVGLKPLAIVGQREENSSILLERPADEWRHYKTIWIASHDD